jgi:ribosomal protein S21
MALPPLSSPRTVWRDMRGFFATRQKHQLVFAAISVAIPCIIALEFYSIEPVRLVYRPPTVVFAKNWNKGRTIAEIKAQQAIDQPLERQARKDEAAFEAKRRADALKLKQALGL